MSEKYKNKYRIPSTRLKNWDYGWSASYFITICTKNREHYFGEIVDGCMFLSDIGKIAKHEWLITPEIRPDMNIELGEFVIMPNHFHSIIIIGENKYNTPRPNDDKLDNAATDRRDVIDNRGGAINNRRDAIDKRRDAMHCVSTNYKTKNRFGPQSKNLASVIRGFKIAVTKNARIICADFAWQPRFYDHIIRNDKSYTTIAEYIKDNPAKWKEDRYYK